LAFDYTSELTMKGNQSDILRNLSVSDDGKTFHLTNGGTLYTLKPLYKIEKEVYGVFATIRNY
jgi:uncharacterized protein